MRRRSNEKTVPDYNNLPVYSGNKRRKTKEQVEAIKAQAETEAKKVEAEPEVKKVQTKANTENNTSK